MDRDSSDGILWRRGPLRQLPQLQVVGHTPTNDRDPVLTAKATPRTSTRGPCLGATWPACASPPPAKVLDIILIPVDPQDLLNKALFTHLSPR